MDHRGVGRMWWDGLVGGVGGHESRYRWPGLAGTMPVARPRHARRGVELTRLARQGQPPSSKRRNPGVDPRVAWCQFERGYLVEGLKATRAACGSSSTAHDLGASVDGVMAADSTEDTRLHRASIYWKNCPVQWSLLRKIGHLGDPNSCPLPGLGRAASATRGQPCATGSTDRRRGIAGMQTAQSQQFGYRTSRTTPGVHRHADRGSNWHAAITCPYSLASSWFLGWIRRQPGAVGTHAQPGKRSHRVDQEKPG